LTASEEIRDKTQLTRCLLNSQVQLIINALTVPASLLALADEVTE